MSDFDKKIFKNKTYSDLLEEIYDNQKKKEKMISKLISELKDLVVDVGDATVIVPLIASYLDVGVKNDDHLLKMATILQRIYTSQEKNGSKKGGDLEISEEERKELLALVSEYNDVTSPLRKK